jgi:hypothetical protein
MKKMKLAISTVVLLATLGVVGFSDFQTASAKAIVGSKCNCAFTNGDLGVIKDGDCSVENCWVPIET